jgi:hypothetical protein
MTETITNEEKSSETTAGFNEIKAETVKLFNLLGGAVSVTFQELTNRLLVRLDSETRRRLDLLVEYGAAQDRQEALRFLVAEGIKANHPLFERVEHANAQVVSLRTQLRALNFEAVTMNCVHPQGRKPSTS